MNEKTSKAATHETVLTVRHWTERLFSFRITRPQSFRFRSGEFVMIGLEIDGKPVMRAYSVASPAWDEKLEFYSVVAPDGVLTPRLSDIQIGDKVLLGRKPTGTLLVDSLLPGKRLWLISTGTGVAPFASILRDPDTYERFDEIILTQSCWYAKELGFGEGLMASLPHDPLVGEEAAERVRFYPTVTREAYPRTERITTLIENGELFSDLGVARFDKATDRVMICGSMGMLADTKRLCEEAGLTEGSSAAPGEFVVEKAFVG